MEYINLRVVWDVVRWFTAFKAAHCRMTVRNFRQQTVYVVLFIVTLLLIASYYKNY
jgi:hypothetical protein